MGPQIFLCHSKQDATIATTAADALRAAGASPILNNHNASSANWDALVFIATPSSVNEHAPQRHELWHQLMLARQENRPIIHWIVDERMNWPDTFIRAYSNCKAVQWSNIDAEAQARIIVYEVQQPGASFAKPLAKTPHIEGTNPNNLFPSSQYFSYCKDIHGAQYAQLLAWAISPSQLSVRVLTGPRGVGKSRLAYELGQNLASRGWQAPIFVNPSHFRAEQIPNDQPQLIVFDDADSIFDLNQLLATEIETPSSSPKRILLVADDITQWWQHLLRNCFALATIDIEQTKLLHPTPQTAQTLLDEYLKVLGKPEQTLPENLDFSNLTPLDIIEHQQPASNLESFVFQELRQLGLKPTDKQLQYLLAALYLTQGARSNLEAQLLNQRIDGATDFNAASLTTLFTPAPIYPDGIGDIPRGLGDATGSTRIGTTKYGKLKISRTWAIFRSCNIKHSATLYQK